MSAEPPDTVVEVATAIAHHTSSDQNHPELFLSEAEVFIAAHRKALADAGWVEAPKVTVLRPRREVVPFIHHLQSLGLPIELDDA